MNKSAMRVIFDYVRLGFISPDSSRLHAEFKSEANQEIQFVPHGVLVLPPWGCLAAKCMKATSHYSWMLRCISIATHLGLSHESLSIFCPSVL